MWEAECRAPALVAKGAPSLSPIWRGPGRRRVCRGSEGASTGQSLWPLFKTEGITWDITLYIQAGKGSSETGCQMKTGCWGIALPPRLHLPHPEPQWLPSSLFFQEVSHLHIIIQVLISTGCAERLSAGGIWGACQSCQQCRGSHCRGWAPRPLCWLSDCTRLTLVPSYFGSAPHGSLTSAPSCPGSHPAKTRKRWGWGWWSWSGPRRAPYPSSLPGDAATSGVDFPTELLDRASSPPTGVSPAYLRHRAGTFLTLPPRSCLWTWPVGPRKQCDFRIKERIFHLAWVYLFPLPNYFTCYSFTLPQFPC